ncbi:hypothetical protein SARC_10159 [Sphaeroforma arctica JP610]|uniref:Uncharacterized protein n=1 Tax=Sphaeroforma arctica JP610 TaxID=667725 RepID=A0A0L0FMV0_9EUKA|nr:hypothetical protein SARC_10159 [Sphaeroforma arctica JP610]KNC77378.1 hypothetical protein SARC_10159 [Sphaeroforma arctica JP610]|eukprot:XP_014151280.1 hypothetical protein SARC_10159 [Sphaeroforma arctica JP610]
MCEAEEMSDLAPARIIYSPNKGTYKHVRALAIPPASAVISHDDHESDWSGQKDENKQEEDLHTRTYDTEPIEQPYKPYTYNNNDETIELTHEHTYDRTDTDSVRATASNDEVDGSDGVGGMAGSTSCRNRPLPPLPIPANKHIVVHAEMFGTVPLPSDEEYDNSQLQADGSSASESGLDLHELPGAPVDVFVSLSEAESTDTNTAVWNATGHRVDSDLSVDDLDILEFSDDLDLPEIPEILSDGHDVEDCCDVNDLMGMWMG